MLRGGGVCPKSNQKKEFARDILLSPFPLIDLTIIPDDEILRHQHAAVMELIQKHIFQRNIQEAIEQLKQHGHLALIHDLNHGQYLIKVVEYIIRKGEAASPEIVIEALKNALPDDEDTVMTVAEQLRQQGMQLGANEKQHEIAKNMLADGIDASVIAKTTGVSSDVLTKLTNELQSRK